MSARDEFESFQKSRVLQYDAGLRSYMQKIYSYMAAALGVTGLISYFSAQSPDFVNAMYIVQDNVAIGTKPLAWVVMLAPVLLVFLLGFSLPRLSLPAIQISFWIYAVLMGLSSTAIFLAFSNESIARVFFITAGTFGGMSLYGYLTKSNLSSVGSFMMMGLVGLIIASLVNLFLKSSGLQFALSIIGIIVFTGLTAFDTQRIRQMYDQFSANEEWAGKAAIWGALTLYLDFINIFLSLLNLFGDRRK